MKKKFCAVAFASVLAVSLLGGCSSGQSAANEEAADQETQAQEEVKAEPLVLDGTWITTNSSSEDSWQEATIDGDVITINWVSDNGDTTALYWAGSVVEPTDETVEDVYTWDSVNDTEKTGSALLASSDDTKTFTYDNGVLSYEASAMGTTKTMTMERVS